MIRMSSAVPTETVDGRSSIAELQRPQANHIIGTGFNAGADASPALNLDELILKESVREVLQNTVKND
jgi:hypothetical protein